VVAQDDMIAPPYLSEELAAKIPGAELAVLHYCGHFVPLIEPAAYNLAIRRFLLSDL
jgi:aminoacrylate hydrolase